MRWFLRLHPIFNILKQCHDFSRRILKGALKIYNNKFQHKNKLLAVVVCTVKGLHGEVCIQRHTLRSTPGESILGIKPASLLLFLSRTETLFNLLRSVLFHLSCSAHEDVSAGQFQVVRWAPEWDEPAVAVTYCCPWHGIGLSGNLRDNGRSASLPDCWVI